MSDNELTVLATLTKTRLVDSGRQLLLDNLTEIIKEVFDVSIVAISLAGESNQFFISIQGLNNNVRPRDISFCEHVYCHNSSLFIPDVSEDPRFQDDQAKTGIPDIRFYAGIPIEYQSEARRNILGVLSIIDNAPRMLEDTEWMLLKKFAYQVECIIESYMFSSIGLNSASTDKQHETEKIINDLLKQNILYRNLSEIDELTGFPNRRFLSNYLNRFWFNDARQHCLSVLIIDLDRFKYLNDTYGHNFGDKVLIDAAAKMVGVLRYKEDTIIRLGGDEFILLLVGVVKENAFKVAQKILSSISKISIPDNNFLTASIGLISVNSKSMGMDAIIEHADAAMYQAKKQGKSRIHCG